MTWLYLSLGAALFWAVGQVLVKKGFENVPPLWNNIIYNFLSLFIWIPVILWLSDFKINVPSLPIASIIFLAGAALMVFFYAISKGEIALTGTVVAGYPVATIILSYLFLGERVTVTQLFGIILVLAGILVISLPERGLPREVRGTSWIRWGFVAAVLIGSSDFLSKVSVNQIGSYSHVFFLVLLFQLLSVGNYLVDKKGRPLPNFDKGRFLPTLLGTVVLSIGSLVFFLAFDYGKASLITPVSSIYPALLVILAMTFLKEKVTAKQGAGIVSAVLGIILIGLGSG